MGLTSNAFITSKSLLFVSDLVNQGTSTARGLHASLYNWIVYKRGSKARERKGEEGQRRSMFYAIFTSRERNLRQSVAIY